jgi:hypothetical protein
VSFCIELFCVVTLQYQILVRIAIAYFIIEKKKAAPQPWQAIAQRFCSIGSLRRLTMNRAIGKYKCPCCGFYTFDEKLNGNYDICPVCFWEDDPIQLEDNEYEGGANRVSLIQARHNFLLFGACEEEMKKHVRKPKEDELRGID